MESRPCNLVLKHAEPNPRALTDSIMTMHTSASPADGQSRPPLVPSQPGESVSWSIRQDTSKLAWLLIIVMLAALVILLGGILLAWHGATSKTITIYALAVLAATLVTLVLVIFIKSSYIETVVICRKGILATRKKLRPGEDSSDPDKASSPPALCYEPSNFRDADQDWEIMPWSSISRMRFNPISKNIIASSWFREVVIHCTDSAYDDAVTICSLYLPVRKRPR